MNKTKTLKLVPTPTTPSIDPELETLLDEEELLSALLALTEAADRVGQLLNIEQPDANRVFITLTRLLEDVDRFTDVVFPDDEG